MEWLFDTSNWPPRFLCGIWTPWHVRLHMLAQVVFALSYFAIPLTLLWLWHKKRTALPKPWTALLFASFIFFCGLTHVLEAAAFVWPAYRFATLVALTGAAVSFVTAVSLPSVVAYVADLPTPEEYRRTLELLQKNLARRAELEAEKDRTNRELRVKLSAAREKLEGLHHRYITGRDEKEIRLMIAEIVQTATGGKVV